MKKNDNKFEELVSKINELKLSDEQKDTIIRTISDIEIDFNRLKKSTDMQIEELNIEKEILINNFIRKDDEVNTLNKKLQEYESSLIFRLNRKTKKVKNKVVGLCQRKK